MTAVELDELMSRLASAPPAVQQALLDLVPQHVLDQHIAAADEAIRTASAALGTAPQMRRRDDIPDWVRLGLLDALHGLLSGTARVCLHNPTVRTATPLYAAAWRPGVITCGQCLHLLKIPGSTRGDDRDRTCDLCGRVCAGVEHGDPIYPSAVIHGALTFQFGTCADCSPNAPTPATARVDTEKERT